jgi:hypothetical protein
MLFFVFKIDMSDQSVDVWQKRVVNNHRSELESESYLFRSLTIYLHLGLVIPITGHDIHNSRHLTNISFLLLSQERIH